MALVIDTGPLLALLDRSEPDHQRCRKLVEMSTEPIVVPAPVLVELDYLVRSRMHWAVFVSFLSDIFDGAYLVADLAASDYSRVSDLCHQYADSDIGFVDAAVVAIAERLNEPKIATLDRRHFGIIRPRHVDSFVLLPT